MIELLQCWTVLIISLRFIVSIFFVFISEHVVLLLLSYSNNEKETMIVIRGDYLRSNCPTMRTISIMLHVAICSNIFHLIFHAFRIVLVLACYGTIFCIQGTHGISNPKLGVGKQMIRIRVARVIWTFAILSD